MSVKPQYNPLRYYSFETDEGVKFTPVLVSHFDKEGEPIGFELWTEAEFPDGSEYKVGMVPSTATGEGEGTGNVFMYYGDEPFTHFAWKDTSNREEEY